jgi:hypothetical protein
MIFERLALGSAIQSGQPPWPNSDPPKNHQELLRSRKVKFQEYKTNFPITGGGLLSRHVIDNGCPVFGPFNRPKFEMSPVHQDCLVLFRKYCEALSLWAQHNPLEYRRRAYALMTPMEAEKQANEDFDMLHSEGIFPRTSSRTRSESQRPGTSSGGMRVSGPSTAPSPDDVSKDALSVHLGGAAPRFPHTRINYAGEIVRTSLESRKRTPSVNPASRRSSTSTQRRSSSPVSVFSRLGTRQGSSPRASASTQPGTPPRRESPPRRFIGSTPPRRPGSSVHGSGKRTKSPYRSPDGGLPRTRSRYHRYELDKRRRRQ